jgi:hypothetical protein
VFNATLNHFCSYIVAISFIGGGKQEYPEETTVLPQVKIDKKKKMKKKTNSMHPMHKLKT